MNIKLLTKGLTVKDVSDVCGISPQAVYKWEKTGIVPAEHVLKICRRANWAVTPHELNKDIYPHPLDGMPKQQEAA